MVGALDQPRIVAFRFGTCLLGTKSPTVDGLPVEARNEGYECLSGKVGLGLGLGLGLRLIRVRVKELWLENAYWLKQS